jgi:urease alpha subunit
MPSNNTPKTVLLRGNDQAFFEAVAVAACTPGQLLIIDNAGKVRPHNVAAGVAMPIFAREEEYVGGTIDTAYAVGDQVTYVHCKSGDEVYAWLKNGVTSVIGGFLESDGAGAFQLGTHAVTNAATAAAWPVAMALEAVNNSGGGSGPNSTARVKVRIL